MKQITKKEVVQTQSEERIFCDLCGEENGQTYEKDVWLGKYGTKSITRMECWFMSAQWHYDVCPTCFIDVVVKFMDKNKKKLTK